MTDREFENLKVPTWVKIALSPWSILLWAFTGGTMWGWFVTPLGLPPIGLAHAYGITLLASLWTKPYTQYEGHQPQDAINVVISFVWPLVCLGMGWIAHTIMVWS